MSRRELLAEMGVRESDLGGRGLQILLERAGVTLGRLIEVMRTDEESVEVVDAYDRFPGRAEELTPELLAAACGMTQRRVWELFCGASLANYQEVTAALLSERIPIILKKALDEAERDPASAVTLVTKFLKAAPTLRRSRNAEQDAATERISGDLEGADPLLMTASALMKGKNVQ